MKLPPFKIVAINRSVWNTEPARENMVRELDLARSPPAGNFGLG